LQRIPRFTVCKILVFHTFYILIFNYRDTFKVSTYRSYQLYERDLNQGISVIFFNTQLNAYIQSSYLSVMVINSIGNLEFTMAAFGTIQAAPCMLRIKDFLWAMAEMNSASAGAVAEWKAKAVSAGDESGGKFKLRVIKSCRVLQLSASGMYGIKKNTLLTFLSGVMTNIVSTLIAFKRGDIY